jgi:hypothetical protein
VGTTLVFSLVAEIRDRAKLQLSLPKPPDAILPIVAVPRAYKLCQSVDDAGELRGFSAEDHHLAVLGQGLSTSKVRLAATGCSSIAYDIGVGVVGLALRARKWPPDSRVLAEYLIDKTALLCGHFGEQRSDFVYGHP